MSEGGKKDKRNFDEEAFLKAMHAWVEREGITYGFRRNGIRPGSLERAQTQTGITAQETRQALAELGIDAYIVDGAAQRNQNGITTERAVKQATTMDCSNIFIN